MSGDIAEIVKKYRSFEAFVKKHGEVEAMALLKKQVEHLGLRRKNFLAHIEELK